jgi:glucans biosynthesis protein C
MTSKASPSSLHPSPLTGPPVWSHASQVVPRTNSSERFHSLDALRGFVMLLGICLHAALPFKLLPGLWAVGTTEPAAVPTLFVYYVHCFRMEVFFLLAGFFAGLVIGKRGLRSYIKDRAVRIVLVFIVALYPMKLLLTGAWIIGGKHTAWLQLPPEIAALPWWQLAVGRLVRESWPEINLTHLWFLYYLACITALFLAVHGLVVFILKPQSALSRAAHALFRRVFASWLAPVAMVAVTMPPLLFMTGFDVDTPEQGLAWHWPVLALYSCFFAMGWLLHRHHDLLTGLERRWMVFLSLSLVVGLAAGTGVAIQVSSTGPALEHAAALRRATAFGTSLTMNLAVLGWLGLFIRLFPRPLPWVRYVADSSYWIYLIHLPVVVALQVGLATWIVPWWIQWPLISAITFPVLLLSYHWLVRRTWIGAWLNGRSMRSAPSNKPVKTEYAADIGK